MNDPFYAEYFELLKGAKEHLSSAYPKGSYILAEKENWEALRHAMTISRQHEQKAPLKPSPKITPPTIHPTQTHSSPTISQVTTPSTPPPVKQMMPAQPPKPSAPPEAKRVVEEKINRSLSLAETPATPEIDFKGWKEIFQDKFPQIQLVEPARESKGTETSIAIVYESVSAQELAFLQNIARSCHLLLGPTRLLPLAEYQKRIESEPQKMVLCYGVAVTDGLPIEQLSVYIQTPALKAQLWRQLSSKFMQKSS